MDIKTGAFSYPYNIGFADISGGSYISAVLSCGSFDIRDDAIGIIRVLEV